MKTGPLGVDTTLAVLVFIMALYKGLELLTAKHKLDQTRLRINAKHGNYMDSQNIVGASAGVTRARLRSYVRDLSWLCWIQENYPWLSLGLILVVFATLGGSILLFESVRKGETSALAVAACTLQVSVYGAVVNLLTEKVRLLLDEIVVPRRAP